MPHYILNPRRVPRAPIPCLARVALRSGGFFATAAVDYSSKGCQLEAPGPLEPSTRAFIELVNERVPDAGELSGRVAWSAQAQPWRVGIAFDEGSLPAAGRFFERLVAAYPGVYTCDGALDRIPEDALLAPASPPQGEPRLQPEEASLLRAVGSGIRADALRASLGERWEASLNPLFVLFRRGYLVVGAPDERAAAEWAPHLVQAAAES